MKYLVCSILFRNIIIESEVSRNPNGTKASSSRLIEAEFFRFEPKIPEIRARLPTKRSISFALTIIEFIRATTRFYILAIYTRYYVLFFFFFETRATLVNELK